MATSDQIAKLRLLVSEPTETTYTDVMLDDRIDALSGNLDRAAYDIWVEKAAKYAQLSDTSEGGSSRSMGQLHDKALAMVELFAKQIAATEAAASLVANPPGVVIHRLTR